MKIDQIIVAREQRPRATNTNPSIENIASSTLTQLAAMYIAGPLALCSMVNNLHLSAVGLILCSTLLLPSDVRRTHTVPGALTLSYTPV